MTSYMLLLHESTIFSLSLTVCYIDSCDKSCTLLWGLIIFGKMLELQLLSQLVHVANCEWWSKSGGFVWVYKSTTHNSTHGKVVVKVMILTLL